MELDRALLPATSTTGTVIDSSGSYKLVVFCSHVSRLGFFTGASPLAERGRA